MATKKIPISFNAKDQANIIELVKYMGIIGVYGDLPQAVKFGIKLALSTIKNPEKVYTSLKPIELQQFFKCVYNYEIEVMAENEARQFKIDANSITPTTK